MTPIGFMLRSKLLIAIFGGFFFGGPKSWSSLVEVQGVFDPNPSQKLEKMPILHPRSSTTPPNPKVTPGDLCTMENPDFQKLDYQQNIPRCNRRTPIELKVKVANYYGSIPRDQWHQFEFDHLIPLCAGGSNSERNIWPQPKEQALEKDHLEDQICTGLKRNLITQEEAIERIRVWFNYMTKNGVELDWSLQKIPMATLEEYDE